MRATFGVLCVTFSELPENRGRLAAAIGSGGGYALAAARALIDMPDLTAMAVGAPCCNRRLGFAFVPAKMILL